MVRQLLKALAKGGCPNDANDTLGGCLSSQLSLSFLVHFRSCLIDLPVYSSNIFRLRSLKGLKSRKS